MTLGERFKSELKTYKIELTDAAYQAVKLFTPSPMVDGRKLESGYWEVEVDEDVMIVLEMEALASGLTYSDVILRAAQKAGLN